MGVSVLMREGERGSLRPTLVMICIKCVVVGPACVCVCACSASRLTAHLKALGADLLAFLFPGDSGFGLPGGQAHKGRNSS